MPKAKKNKNTPPAKKVKVTDIIEPKTLKQLKALAKNKKGDIEDKITCTIGFIGYLWDTLIDQNKILHKILKDDIAEHPNRDVINFVRIPADVMEVYEELKSEEYDGEDVFKRMIASAEQMDWTITMYADIIDTFENTENDEPDVKAEKRDVCFLKYVSLL